MVYILWLVDLRGEEPNYLKDIFKTKEAAQKEADKFFDELNEKQKKLTKVRIEEREVKE